MPPSSGRARRGQLGHGARDSSRHRRSPRDAVGTRPHVDRGDDGTPREPDLSGRPDFSRRRSPPAPSLEGHSGARYVIVAVPSHGLRAVVGRRSRLFPMVPCSSARRRASRPSRSSGCPRSSSRKHTADTPSSCCPGRASRPRWRGNCRRRSSPPPPMKPRLRAVQEEFRGPFLRLYGSDDVVGVEIGAALKNIIAIAAGVVEGLGLGHNALAALITRGLAEMTRLACAMGGRRDARRAERPRRSRADVHGQAQPQSSRRDRIGPRTVARRDSLRHAHGGRGRADDRRRSRWASGTASSCRSPRRWPRCWPAARRRRAPSET